VIFFDLVTQITQVFRRGDDTVGQERTKETEMNRATLTIAMIVIPFGWMILQLAALVPAVN
jgi:hypothetical protein